MEPIAITGFSFKLPQGAEDEESFWEILKTGKNVMTPWPESRVSMDTFYRSDPALRNTISAKGAHFLQGDPAAFDAPFFAITGKEATSMDPQQRLLLETAYLALENAGIPVEHIAGTNAAVFGGCMTEDYLRIINKDPDKAPTNTASGTSPAILANRLSWYFDLRGPSIQVDTACSSSMVATHLAVQSLQTGQTSVALVTGSNLILRPETSIYLSNMNFLSPDGQCYSFDHRANGYARGEGLVVLVLKRLQDAIRDGDQIRAVIRASGSNQDGRTPGITQPSMKAQEQLIRDVYKSCNLQFKSTRYVEAHGTGTQIGDWTEATALGRAFRASRSPREPLYIGSLKANFGHVEGASGVAAILKCIMILEKGIIPPNALFEKLNPKINAKSNNLCMVADANFHGFTQIPTTCVPWPTEGLRRVSVNSFGFGGTNGHIIMDDACNTLKFLAIQENRRTLFPLAIPKGTHDAGDTCPATGASGSTGNGNLVHLKHDWKTTNGTNSLELTDASPEYQLLVWSARDEAALARMLTQFEQYSQSRVRGSRNRLRQLAYTLNARRSVLTWRSFAVVATAAPTEDWRLVPSKGVRPSREKALAFIFTGQGAQYAKMGLELLRYPVFQSVLSRVDAIFNTLGADWSLLEELHHQHRINTPQLSQPLCTALQLALIELLSSFGIVPDVVIGHSSGEIAAAYAVGGLSLESACRIAYHRGRLVEMLIASSTRRSAMMSVDIRERDIDSYIQESGLEIQVEVACINSPSNVTISGDEASLDQLKEQLDRDHILARKLKTGVAYHSQTMEPIADQYLRCLDHLTPADAFSTRAFMISSVTGQRVATASLAQGQYWVDNLTSPVRFADSLQYLVLAAPKVDGIGAISDYVEIGPHGALRRPLHETVGEATGGKPFRYTSALSKFDPPSKTILSLVGQLFAHGYPVSVTAAIQQDPDLGFLVDLPPYPFDHSQLYWHETRLSRDWSLRGPAPRETLGVRVTDWNPLQPRWRKTVTIEEMPWIADHVIGETILVPATGTMMMALEAVKQMTQSHLTVSAFRIQEAVFVNPIVVHREGETEIITQLRPLHNSYEKTSSRFEVQVFAYVENYGSDEPRGGPRECFKAIIHIEHNEAKTQVDGGSEARAYADALALEYSQAKDASVHHVAKEDFYAWLHKQGLRYGANFSLADDIYWDGGERAVAQVAVGPPMAAFTGIVHPAAFDAACQVAYTAPSQGISKQLSTIIPHRIRNAWISATGWQYPSTTHLRIMTASRLKSVGSGIETSVIVLGQDDSPVCHIKEFELLPVLTAESQESEDRRLLHRIQWEPQLSLLTSEVLEDHCDAAMTSEDKNSAVQFHSRLIKTLRSVLRQNTSQLRGRDWPTPSLHMTAYIDWLREKCRIFEPQNSYTNDQISAETSDDALEVLKMDKPSWTYFTGVAQNLTTIVRGDTDIHDVTSTMAIQDFQQGLLAGICNPKLSSYLELLVHENPGLKLLEVGACWDVMTRFILATFDKVETETGGTAFSEYVYTGTDEESLDRARQWFDGHRRRTSFKVLDLEQDTSAQGFQHGAYDLIVISNALHNTENIQSTLQNTRKALRAGGHLIFYEMTPQDPFLMDFAFSTVPSWWSNVPEYRGGERTMVEADWNNLLQLNGFSGNDLVIRDHQDGTAHSGSIIISTATSLPHIDPAAQESRVFLVINKDKDCQRKLATAMVEGIFNALKFRTQICEVTGDRGRPAEAAAEVRPSDYVVFLADIGPSILADISNSTFRVIKAWIQQAKNLLWITCSEPTGTPFSLSDLHAGIKDGFLRTIRAETSGKRIISLSLESRTLDMVCNIKHISQVFECAFMKGGISPDVEYRISQGRILTGRLVEDVQANAELTSAIRPEIREEPWFQGPALKLDMGTRGQMDTLLFNEDDAYCRDLRPDDVEIESKAWAVNFRDMFGALGRLDEDFAFGSDCAGTVTRTGPKCKWVRPGDRVCMCVIGCMRTFPRTSEGAVAKIPDSVTFEEACAVMNPACTSWQALIEIGRLKRGEKVLIHSAAGATGQLAIQIAQMVGAEVYATVGYDHKKQLLIDQYNIPGDHIFYSRNISFARGIMRVTGGYGVDVVLNSLMGEELRASWECIAPGGRFIEIGKADINANSSLPMAFFAKNVTFAAVDLYYILLHRHDQAKQLLHKTMELVEEGHISYPRPLHMYDVSRVENAFRFFQSGENTGRTLIRVDRSTVVQKHLIRRRTWSFSKDASYVVAGGFGGIGRSILMWLAKRGARHLIVPSRSGVKQDAAATVSQLSAQGVNVVAPICDVSSLDALSRALDRLRETMPPIRGCINTAMVLNDATFDNMTDGQWTTTLRSKVQTSWNLHHLLPDLDFFLLLSSVSGVIGNPGQANYAAGCSFQDSLARYRAHTGQKAVSIDLGPMDTIGVVAETESLQQHFERSRSLKLVKEQELISLLDMYCDPTRNFSTAESQVAMGLSTPGEMLARQLEPAEFMQRPLFTFFKEVGDNSVGSCLTNRTRAGELFRKAQSADEQSAVVVEALAEKLARALSMKVQDLDVDQPLHAHGVDSLVAVEIRNWISKEFAADIPVFEINGRRTVASVGELVAKTIQINPGKVAKQESASSL